MRDTGATNRSFEDCDQKDELLAMLDASQRDHVGNCRSESRGRGFYRPFKLLSDQDIMNFLDVNEIPSEIDDVRFLRYVNDHERLVKGLFLPFLFDQRVTLLFFGYHSVCVARVAAACALF
jgi:hypothetical protein